MMRKPITYMTNRSIVTIFIIFCDY